MFMAAGQRMGEGRILKLVKWREDRMINSLLKTWTFGPLEITRSHTDWAFQNQDWVIDGLTDASSSFYLEPTTDWQLSLRIGRLNLEGKWNGQSF